MRIPIQLSKGEQIEVAINIDCRVGEAVDVSHLEGNVLNLIEKRGAEISGVDIYTSNEQFNDWIGRSVADLKMLVTSTSQGLYPYAGVPWFSTIFGRDEFLRVWNICGCVLRLPKGF
jgi:glycogen debranching enzyme